MVKQQITRRKELEKEERNNYLKEVNDRIYEQLSYAEAKHAVLIGFIGAAIFSIISIIIDVQAVELLWLRIWLGVIAATLLAPLIISFLAVYPKTKTLKADKKNLYFYGDIAKYKNAESYLSDINKSDNLNIHIAEQNVLVSSIVVKKHNMFSIALKLCVASIFPPFYLVILAQAIIKKAKGKFVKKLGSFGSC